MKKLNLKQKITDFIKSFKAENEILAEAHRKSPLHEKVSKICNIILIIIMVILWLCSFPSSAADEPIEPEQKYISGKWEFIERPILYDTYITDVNYTNLNGDSFDALGFHYSVDPNDESVDAFYLRHNIPNGMLTFYWTVLGVDEPMYEEIVYWDSPSFKILDFGSTPQPVSDVFWTDFTSIAHPYNEQPMSYTIEEGVYIFDTDHEIFDMEGLTFTYPIPFYDLVYRTFDTLTIHSGYYENGHSYVDIYYDDTRVYKWETLTEPFLSQRGRMIYVTEDTEIAIQGAEAFETYYNYIPLMDYTDFDLCCLTFQFGFDAGFTDGKEVTYESAYNEGYYKGYAEGYDSHGNAGVFGNFFDLVYEALDNIPVYESPDGVVSIIDVIQTILGGFILLFILKLIAGG